MFIFSCRRGSVIASYKLSFNNNLDLSDNTVENIAQVLKNAQNTNFTIDNNSINITGKSISYRVYIKVFFVA